MGKRRKLVVSVTDPRGAIFFRGQLAFMISKGFDVTLVSGPGEIATEIVTSQGARHYPVKMSREINLYSDVKALYRMWRFLRTDRPDIVNATTPKAGFLLSVAAWLARVPVRVYTLRGLRGDTLMGMRRWILDLTERIACGVSHRTICISPSLRQRALATGIVADRKSVVLGSGSSNGIDLTRFSQTREHVEAGREIRNRLGLGNDVVIGFVGRLVNDKGVRELVRAWSLLRESFPASRLLLVGPFEQGDALDPQLRNEIAADPRISHVDFVEDVPPYYIAMDIVVLPSYREGFGNVLIEAGAMGRPVVATRIAGCVDAVVENHTGFLARPRDAVALAAAIETYLRDPALRVQHGRNGRERAVQEFRCERVWELIADEYDRLSASVDQIPVPNPRLSARMENESVAS